MNQADALAELARLVPAEVLSTDADIVESYRHDQSRWGDAGTPLCVARPKSKDEVESVVRWAAKHRIPIVPRGAGSGLSGGASAIAGCVVLSLERMTRIVEIQRDAMYAVVEPGVLNGQLKAATKELGLWYPPDPASFEFSTLGGNVATNAGGLCCVKYGVTVDYVLGLEVVLADGSRIRTGGRTRKNVAGYDLTRLFVGSEGTLGVVTEITLRLRPAPPPAQTLVATFDSLAAAGQAVAHIVKSCDPSLLEIMDQASIRAVEAHQPMDLDTSAAAMLFARSDAPKGAEPRRIREACEAAGATTVFVTEEEWEGDMFLHARRLAFPALEKLGATLVDDVAVPVHLLTEMIRRIERVARETGARVATVGHAGDGNLHPLVLYDAKDPADEARAQKAFRTIMMEAIALGGTITGEHGVGTLKKGFLPLQLGEESLAVQRRVKETFDPLGIMNPGKVI
ncbi:FAD-binding oxidoreductase [Pendulispora albinea]|uniref:FAD-binding protein n=1 Tax=Pendulispora albinea TaxID=2741071 RepID=A0ABZ2MCW7_9BACT